MRSLTTLILAVGCLAVSGVSQAQGHVVDISQTIDRGAFVGLVVVHYDTAAGTGTVSITGVVITNGTTKTIDVEATLQRGRGSITIAGVISVLSDGTVVVMDACPMQPTTLSGVVDAFVDCVLSQV